MSNSFSYIIDSLLEDEPTINKTTVCTYPEPWYPASPSSYWTDIDKTLPMQRPMKDYVGVYSNIAYGDLVISFNKTMHRLQVI